MDEFWFPPTVRRVGTAFAGTAIRCLDLSETRTIEADFSDMRFLERVVLPRGCVWHGSGGVPSLRSLTFGAFIDRNVRASRVRFQSMKSHDPRLRELGGGSPGRRYPTAELLAGVVKAELAVVV